MKRFALQILIVGMMLLSAEAWSMTDTPLFTNFCRDASGNILQDALMSGIRIQVYDTQTGNYIYEETFSEQRSNDYGLFTVIVGAGNIVNGTWSSVPFNPNIWVMLSIQLVENGPFLPIQSIALQTLAWETDAKTEMYFTKANRELSNLDGTRINESLLPYDLNAIDIGSSGFRWRSGYFGPNSVHIGWEWNDVTLSYDQDNNQLQINKQLQVTSGGIQVDNTGVNIDGGGLHVDGTTNLNDGVELGETGSDLISVNGVVDTDILPTGIRNLGSSTSRWTFGYFSANGLQIGLNGNDVNLSYDNGNNELQINKRVNIEIGGLNVSSGTSYFMDNVLLGQTSADLISFNGLANTSIIPNGSGLYDLGTSLRRWGTGYFGPSSVHIGVDGNDVTLAYNTGTNTLGINQNTNVSGTLSQNGNSVLISGTLAGGDLTGTFPNPTIASNAVGAAEIADLTITNSDISSTANIAVTKLGGGSDGQVLKMSGINVAWTSESDPAVGAVNGIVKSNGSGTFSAAVAGTDYVGTSGSSSIAANSGSALIGLNNSGAGTALSVTDGGGAVKFSYGAASTGGGATTIPDDVTVYVLPAASSAYALTMPSATLAGKLLIVVNNDDAATTGTIIASGAKSIFVSDGTSWIQVM